MSKDIYIDYGNSMRYDEEYRDTGELWWKGVTIDSCCFGYIEWFLPNGSINENGTGYFLDHIKVSDTNEQGYCLIWNKVVL